MRSKYRMYENLTEEDKQKVVSLYYERKDLKISELHKIANVSERGFVRVLKEYGINTRLKNRYTLKENYFELIDSERKAYWLGYLYADGYVGDDHYNNIVVSSIDKDILEKFKEDIEYSGEIRVSRGSGYSDEHTSYVINFSSKEMASSLREIGLYPNKSMTMIKMPNLDNQMVNHFIRGYFDGDGGLGIYRSTSYHKEKVYENNSPGVNIIGTHSFLEDMRKSIPVKSSYTQSKTPEMVYLRIHGKKNVTTFMNYIYSDATVFMDRKYNKWLEIAPLCRNV